SLHRAGPLVAPGNPELVEAFGEEIAKHGLAEEITRRSVVAALGGLTAKVLPLLDAAVAAAEPHQRDKIDLLVFAEGVDEAGDLPSHRIGAIVFEHVDHVVVGGVRS